MEPSSLKKGAQKPPYLSAHVYCGQMAECLKMPLDTEVGLGTGHIVLDGTQLISAQMGPVRLCGFCHISTSGLGVGTISSFAETGSSF